MSQLARRERNVVLMTGEIDFISDGDRTYGVRNGHQFLSTTDLGAILPDTEYHRSHHG